MIERHSEHVGKDLSSSSPCRTMAGAIPRHHKKRREWPRESFTGRRGDGESEKNKNLPVPPPPCARLFSSARSRENLLEKWRRDVAFAAVGQDHDDHFSSHCRALG